MVDLLSYHFEKSEYVNLPITIYIQKEMQQHMRPKFGICEGNLEATGENAG